MAIKINPVFKVLVEIEQAFNTTNKKLGDKLSKKHPAIGQLVEKHPDLMFGTVHALPNGGYAGAFMGRAEMLKPGTKVKLWSTGEIINVTI